MQTVDKMAANYWEVEREMTNHQMRPYCVVILRNKKNRKAVVKASSYDFVSMKEYEEELQQDLEKLTDEEFVRKYDLTTIS
ncbi:MAG: hypothetical protein QME62_05770 [Armatimonadota bacterium]|nr:hypothetical protein [Armatimonadota bacterium]